VRYLQFRAKAEPLAGPRWQAVFAQLWPDYRTWFFREGDDARPSYLSCLRALRAAMPELIPTYERLCELAGGGDQAARFLSLWCPPRYLTGCSQVVWTGDAPVLIRNYDYAPQLCEAVVWHTAWNGRRVIGMSDCAWGVLDGVNEDGLAVSLAFGGRRAVGEGFGVPLLLRYVLEFCTTVAGAAEALQRIPIHMAYNVTLLDRAGNVRTLYLSPDRPPVVRQTPLATNHQGRVEWHRHAVFTRSLEREQYLKRRITRREGTAETLLADFLQPPLYSTDYDSGFGTLYTAAYHVTRGEVEYRWPRATWRQSFDHFAEGGRVEHFPREAPHRSRI
jgi:predicted choloylglycine hydrolase